MIATVARLIELIRESQVLGSADLAKLEPLEHQWKDPHPFAKEVLRRGLLTDYQLGEIIKGKGEELVLGSYVILEPVGKGGMGEVFKARHRQRDEIVALKVIRKEKRDDAKSLYRFRREIQALASLSHPNIINAYEADEIGVTHFYAMEYVDGVNLGEIVEHRGKLPIGPACDYIRQAALGLQHAFEKGLIHRDIKPGNLLVAGTGKKTVPPDLLPEARGRLGRWGTVKLLDLGLVRLQDQDLGGDLGTRLTQMGSALGTVDYMAPEQITNAHGVDIRADLYSLGCTFYELLTGKVPFAEGSPVEKLAAHRKREPVPVQALRPEIPDLLAAVVSKLLVKKPELRFQTPADLANVLTGILLHLEPALLRLDWKPPLEIKEEAVVHQPHGADGDGDPAMQYILLGIVVFLAALLLLLILY